MNSTISKAFIIILVIIASASCSSDSSSEEVSVVDNSAMGIWSDTIVKSKYDDGSIHILWGMKPNDSEMHYEWSYYKNGNLWIEGPKYDTLRHGIWKGYNDQGALIARGTYKVGKATGIYTVWYDDGTKFYEGNMMDGKRVGEWSFFDKSSKLLKTVDYSAMKSNNN